MRKVSGIGHVNNRFVDKDPPAVPSGTRINADVMNDIQDDLLSVQEEMGVGESAGTDKGFLSALKRLIIEKSKQVGELFWLEEYKEPEPFDQLNPDTYFPAICLSGYQSRPYGEILIQDSNWPQLNTYLRSRKLRRYSGSDQEDDQFQIHAYEITAFNTARLELDSTVTPALIQDSKSQGNARYRTINLIFPVGPIPAGEYQLKNMFNNAAYIDFTGTPEVNTTNRPCEIYLHRIAGDSSSSILYTIFDRSITTPSDVGDIIFEGLKSEDHFQGFQIGALADFTGQREYTAQARERDKSALLGDYLNYGEIVLTRGGGGGDFNDRNLRPMEAFGFSEPRMGPTTKGKDLRAHLYMWGGRYIGV
jgi:hypothetical protein